MANSTAYHGASPSKPHVIAFPSFPFGHVQPMMFLCEALVASGNITVTFVQARLQHHSVRILRPRNPDIRNVELSAEMPAEHLLDAKRMLAFLEEGLGQQLEKLILDFNRTSSPVTCFIADFCWAWPHVLAKKLNIPLLAGFSPFSLATLYVDNSIPYLLSTGQLLPNGSATVKTFSGLPPFPHLPSARRPWLVNSEEGDKLMMEITTTGLEQAPGVKWILCNSCYDWESTVADAVTKDLPNVRPVGPLFLIAEKAQDQKSNSTTSLSQEGKECMDWLDKQAASSVVYIAFGSSTPSLSGPLIQELSLGLEACGYPFLWVLPSDGKAAELFPEGFAERTRSRSHFVSWAPQAFVLKHSSIGCYLFHCGWNSQAESICLGVPMLAMSFLADQRLNYVTLEEWGAGKVLRPATDELVNGELCRHEVEKAIRCVMSDCEEGKEIRRRVCKLKNAAIAAVEEGGSSYNNLRAFIQDIIKHSKTQS